MPWLLPFTSCQVETFFAVYSYAGFVLIAGLMKKQKRRKRDTHQVQGKGNMYLLKSCLFIMMIQKWKRTSGSEVRLHALYLFYCVLYFDGHMLVTVLWWQEFFLQVLV